MAEGRPPKVIHVYSKLYAKRPHGAWGKVGDRVLMAIKGEKKQLEDQLENLAILFSYLQDKDLFLLVYRNKKLNYI